MAGATLHLQVEHKPGALQRAWDADGLLVVRDGELAVELPRGWRFLLRARLDADGARVTDGGGGEHVVAVGRPLALQVGDATVRVDLWTDAGRRWRVGWLLGLVGGLVVAGAIAAGVHAWPSPAAPAATAPTRSAAPWPSAEPEATAAWEAAAARLAVDPDDLEALRTRAYVAYLRQDYDAAEAVYARMVTIAPDAAWVWNNRALVKKRRGDFVGEEMDYRRALALAPDDPVALDNLAVCLAHQGRGDEAEAILVRLGATTDPYGLLHRATIAAARGDDELALVSLRAAVSGAAALDPLHAAEHRQDVLVDPAFHHLRGSPRFAAVLAGSGP